MQRSLDRVARLGNSPIGSQIRIICVAPPWSSAPTPAAPSPRSAADSRRSARQVLPLSVMTTVASS